MCFYAFLVYNETVQTVMTSSYKTVETWRTVGDGQWMTRNVEIRRNWNTSANPQSLSTSNVTNTHDVGNVNDTPRTGESPTSGGKPGISLDQKLWCEKISCVFFVILFVPKLCELYYIPAIKANL